MKIVTIVRALNEHENISRFCAGYTWADHIIVADGGSTDDTVNLALEFPNVVVIPFHEVESLPLGYTRNPDGKHINWLIRHATEMGADWIVMDDCDSFPNYLLRQDGRKLIEGCTTPYLTVVRMYMFGKKGYFPAMSHFSGSEQWTPGLWAWRANTGLHTDERVIHFDFFVGEQKLNFHKIPVDVALPPYCILHEFFTEENVEAKLKYYRESKLVDGMLHPFTFGGRLDKPLEWMRE